MTLRKNLLFTPFCATYTLPISLHSVSKSLSIRNLLRQFIFPKYFEQNYFLPNFRDQNTLPKFCIYFPVKYLTNKGITVFTPTLSLSRPSYLSITACFQE